MNKHECGDVLDLKQLILLNFLNFKRRYQCLLGEGNSNPFQYSFLENPIDRGTWQATVCGIARVRHDLATKLLLLKFTLEREMATHSSILAWRIPWTGEPSRLQSMGSQRVGHDWVTNTYSNTYYWSFWEKPMICPWKIYKNYKVRVYHEGGQKRRAEEALRSGHTCLYTERQQRRMAGAELWRGRQILQPTVKTYISCWREPHSVIKRFDSAYTWEAFPMWWLSLFLLITAGGIVIRLGTSLMVQWLRICLAMQGTWIQNLVRELRSHMPWSN